MTDSDRAASRHYGMDWLRIGAFALLILYHIGMAFVHWPWHVKTAEPIEWLAVPMFATNAWRLALLFAVSGYASAAILAKGRGSGAFARERTARLLLPVIVAMVLIVPPQPWVELVTQHGYPNGYLAFWLGDYFRFQTLGGLDMPTWQHLWFVVYLWVYTLLLVLVRALLPMQARSAIHEGATRALSGPLVLLTPIALLLANLWWSWPYPEITHALVGDWAAHRIYVPAFLFGILLHGNQTLFTSIRRWWPVGAALAIGGYAVIAVVELGWSGDVEPPDEMLFALRIARQLHAWGAIVALIGIADRYWNHDHPWRARLAEGVFPFYIIHQTIIVVVMYWLVPLGIGALAEFLIVLPVTVAGCWAFYAIGRRIGWLRPLIGLRRVTAARATARTPAAA